MPYNHQLYLDNCRKMIAQNEIQVEKTKRAIKRARDPRTVSQLNQELLGWEEWVERWKQRLKDAEAISN